MQRYISSKINFKKRKIHIAHHRALNSICACISSHVCWKSPERAWSDNHKTCFTYKKQKNDSILSRFLKAVFLKYIVVKKLSLFNWMCFHMLLWLKKIFKTCNTCINQTKYEIVLLTNLCSPVGISVLLSLFNYFLNICDYFLVGK